MLMLLVKIILTPLAGIEAWCRGIVALMLWDDRPIKGEWLFDIIWKKPKTQ